MDDWRPFGLTLEAALNRGDDPALLMDENSPLRGELRRLLAEPAAQQDPPDADDMIREVFLANGFTIKEGQTDLKPYVYAAARELMRRASAVNEFDRITAYVKALRRWE